MPKQRKKQSKAAKNLLESLESTFTDRSGAGSVDDLFDLYDTEVTKQPRVTVQPKVTALPQVTVQPEVTKQPRVTVLPGVTKQPKVTVLPEVTVQPEVTVLPESNKSQIYGHTRRIVGKWIDYIKKKEIRILILISTSKFIRNSRWKTDYIKPIEIVNEIFKTVPDKKGTKSYYSYIRKELLHMKKCRLVVPVDRLPEGFNTKYLVRLPFNINNKIHPKNMSTRRLLVNYMMVDSFLPKIQSDSELLIQFLEYRNNILLELKNRGLKP